ncbi:penicillin-binding protein 1C [Candidatus Roizmanbacteria bacterium]|nr:penicillin-binding protein 1C [Candidatus Roizmanbacteria bacterium]
MKKRKVLFLVLLILLGVAFEYWTDPTPQTGGTVKIYDRAGELLFESAGTVGHREYVSIDDISKDLQQSVVLTEDERFWSHFGVDLLALGRALVQNISSRTVVSGASTIPQQIVRFTVISPQSPPKVSVIRKLREMLMAVRLSLTTQKEQILERYLNVMHFGRETYGVQSASRLYFGKDASNVSLAESALLAGMIANPSKYDPLNNTETVLERRNDILARLLAKKIIDQERYERAVSEEIPRTLYEPTLIAPHIGEMVADYLMEQKIPITRGIRVFTTIDRHWYEKVLAIARRHVSLLSQKHDMTNAAVVVLENKTGNVLTLIGSINYFDDTIGGKNNMATAVRQPGSALKPVTYAAAFQKRLATPATVIDDNPKVYMTGRGEGFTPHNYDGRYRGPVLVREALASSYNLPAVEMIDRVGVDSFLDLAHQMGITSMNESDRYDLALTLGGGEVSLIELTNVYATLAHGGVWMPYQFISRIETDTGKELLVNSIAAKDTRRVLDAQVAYLITDILSDPKARIPTFGEKNPLLLSKPAAVKTGTTTDWHDNWTIGYTKDFTVGVWVGNADNHPMRDISGITGAAPIWNQVMEELLTFSNYYPFVKPEGLIEEEICAWDGLLPGTSCSEQYDELFIEGTQPKEVTTLTSRPFTLTTNVHIITPRAGAIYEYSTSYTENLVFELSSNSVVHTIIWMVDGNKIPTNVWIPTEGRHQVTALATTLTGETVSISPVQFEVVAYKKGW